MRPDLASAYRYGRTRLGLTAAQALRRARLRLTLACPCAEPIEPTEGRGFYDDDDGPDPRDAWRQDARTELKGAP